MITEIVVQRINQRCPLAVVRLVARPQEFSTVVPKYCGVVWNALRAQQVKGAGRHVAVYLDDIVNLEVGVEMDAPYSGNGEVVASSVPMGLVAGTAHFGPYQKLGEAHAAIKAWCAQNGYELAGPKWEIYGHWDQTWNTAPSKIRTDVFYLLKDGAAGRTWQPFREPIQQTLLRTGLIALLAGAVLAWRWGDLKHWPRATLLMLWFALGGHWVELLFLNVLRPRLPVARAVQVGVRVAMWFLGGIVLGVAMKWTAVAMGEARIGRWMSWWRAGVVFIAIELVAHLVLWMRRFNNFFDGRG